MKTKVQMNKKKFGFTVAEVLIAFAIIGVLTAVSLSVAKQVDRKETKYLYINAYNSLSKAYYNGLINQYNPFDELDKDRQPITHEANSDRGTEILCQGITNFINTRENLKNAQRDFSETCSPTKLTSENADNFTDDNVQFIANNGMKFYITRRLGDDELYFYIVFVDLNGNKMPNTILPVRNNAEVVTREPDIFSFAILSSGYVIPIGYAEYSSSVLTAKLAYMDNEGNVQYTRMSYPYYQAKGLAWGFYSSPGVNPLQDYEDAEPFTMNDIVRENLNPNSNIVRDFPDLRGANPGNIASGEPFNCGVGDLENCYIWLDSYWQY